MTAIIGTQGNDILSGVGNDAMSGDLGDDTYLIDSDKDTTFERTYSGNDTVKFDSIYYSNTTSFKLAANIENLDLSGLNFLHSTPSVSNYLKTHNFVINGNSSNNTITASSTCTTAMQIFAGSGADTVYGGSNSDNIDGGYGCDTLFGNAGNDTLFGGNDVSVDSLIGGDGNDTYILRDTKDFIIDISGLNTLKLSSYFTENKIDLTNTHYKDLNINTIDASAVTKALNLITNVSTNTTIMGGSGNDVIKSGSGNDSLNGGLGNDYLFAGAGSNALNGGLGNDTYAIDGSETSTKIIDSGGADTIKLMADTNGMFKKDSPSLATFSNIEILDGSSIKNTDLTLTGNNLANTITGGSGNDSIKGGYGDDYLDGGLGNDKIVGGVGNDTMIGGKGDDVYYSDSSNDSIVELANRGNDTIKIESNYYSETKFYTLAKEVENLDMSGLSSISFSAEVDNPKTSKLVVNGNLLDNVITSSSTCGASMQILASAGNDTVYGGNSNDYIDGGSGNDLLQGGAGNDIILGVAGNDKLYGEDGNDILKGGAGKDFLNGGKGNDTISGGAGNNTYFFNKDDGKDLITATNKGDIIKINNADGIAKNDLLFYTDDSGNFFVDYTNNDVGTDTIEITKGKYNGSTTVQVGGSTININSIISQLASSGTAGLDSSSITALNTATETAQTLLLASAWTTA